MQEFQIQFSNSVQPSDVIHRPLCWSGAGLRLHFLFPHMCEGAERRLALLLSLAPRRRCRVPLRGTPPPGARLWRLPSRDRLVGSGPGTFIPVIRAAFAALHPDRTGLLSKAALRSKGEREPRETRTSVRVHSGAGATPAPSTKTPLEDALTEQASRQYRGLGTAQE